MTVTVFCANDGCANEITLDSPQRPPICCSDRCMDEYMTAARWEERRSA
jgi:hypothetical protein